MRIQDVIDILENIRNDVGNIEVKCDECVDIPYAWPVGSIIIAKCEAVQKQFVVLQKKEVVMFLTRPKRHDWGSEYDGCHCRPTLPENCYWKD